MADELRQVNTGFNIEIMGLNEAALESLNNSMTQNLPLPWLQDTSAQSVWQRWGVTYRDVRILDARGRLAGVYNLSKYDLSQAQYYSELKNMLQYAARMVDQDGDKLPDDWELLHFNSLDATGLVDADHDGQSNLQELYFGGNPESASPSRSLNWVFKSNSGTAMAWMQFRRLAGGPWNYFVESSTNLVQWSAASGLGTVSISNNFDGTGTMTATLPWTTWPQHTNGPQFFRVRAGLR